MNLQAEHSGPKHKESAMEFLRLIVAGNIREAFRKYAGPNFRHHNPFFPGDAESLMIGMEENAVKNPHQILNVRNTLEDGDLVAIHSLIMPKPDDLGWAVVHLFRFEGETISEMWDIGQAVPENSPNENEMF